MDTKSKILIWVFVVLIIGSVGFTYWRIMIKRDYIISAQTDCDPYTEQCFFWECDPNSIEDGVACTDNADDNSWYYQIVRRKAFNIPLCDPKDENCQALICPEGEADCSVEFCTAENVPEGETCNDPVKYTEENPVEEEATEEGVTECDSASDEECPEAGEEEATEEEAESGDGAWIKGSVRTRG